MMFENAVRFTVESAFAGSRQFVQLFRIPLSQCFTEVVVRGAELVKRLAPILLSRGGHGRKVQIFHQSSAQAGKSRRSDRLPEGHVHHDFPDGMRTWDWSCGCFPGRDTFENWPDGVAVPRLTAKHAVIMMENALGC
jgi:hypothetical protein